MATEHGPAALWLEAAPWIVDTVGAIGGQIMVDLAAPVRRACGRVDDSQRRLIEQWEQELQGLEDWMPAGHSSLSGKPPVPPVALRTEVLVAHIPIYLGRSLFGGLSLVFGAESRPGADVLATASLLAQSLAVVAKLAAERYQLQRRLTQGNLLYEVSRAISSSLEINDVLNFTTALAANALGAEGSALCLVDQSSNELVCIITYGALAEPLRGRRMAVGEGAIGRVVSTGQPLSVANATPEALFGSSQLDLTVRNLLFAPLQVKGDTLGVLQVLNREGGGNFTAEDMEWLMALAGQASVAVENARLYSTLREERDRIIQAEEEVRRRLASNLHDSAAQLMGSLLMNIEIARKLAQSRPEALEPEFDLLRELAQQANQELRQALLELRPLLLETRGLIGALQGYVNQQRRRGHVISLGVEGALPEMRNRQAETAIYLILQEALTNVRKHANARHTWLRLHVQPPLLLLEVEDDGDGMAQVAGDLDGAELGRMGMLTMRERVQWLEGRLGFQSPCRSDGRGTLVRIELPLARLTTPPDANTASWIIATQKSA